MPTPFWRRSVSLGLVSSLLAGCVSQLPPLPSLPREPLDRLRQSVAAMREAAPPVEFPKIEDGGPPAQLECKPAQGQAGFWLCRGDPQRMGKGQGLFFAFDGSAKSLAEHLAAERILRQLVPVLEARIMERDVMLGATMTVLDTLALMAEEYRTIAVVRGDEIARLQRDRIIDRFTLLIPVFGIGAGIVYLLVK